MNAIKIWWKQTRCNHKYKILSEEHIGSHIDTRQFDGNHNVPFDYFDVFQIHERCLVCDKMNVRDKWVLI